LEGSVNVRMIAETVDGPTRAQAYNGIMELDSVDARRAALEAREQSWRPMGLAARFDVTARSFPDRPYVLTESSQFSYSEMVDWSTRLARGLYGLGVRPGDAVAMVVDNRPEFIAVKLAIARLGATAVPINFAYRAPELAAVLATSEACVLISISSSIGVDRLAVLDEVLPGWDHGATSPSLPHLRHVLLVSADGRPDLRDLRWLAEHPDGSDETIRSLTEGVDPDAPCDIVFTSGTSGNALGAVLTHDMVLRSAYGSAYHRGFADGWRIGFSLPLYHVFGYIEGLLAAMFAGGAVAPHPVFNPRSILTSIERHRLTEVLFVPTMSVAVVEEAAKRDYDLSSLESVFSAAAPAPVWLWERIQERLRPRVVFTGYGQTEVSAATTLTAPGDPLDVVSETVGREKLGGVAADGGVLAHYRTVDPFRGEPLPAGAEGELTVRGPIVTHGYFRDPERTAALIDADGWLRTGDLGRIRSDGYLELTGRSKELFKVGGELVAPKQVEQVLTGHPQVGQAYVAGVPDERFGEVGWAWVVPAEGAAPSDAELIRHCRQALAAFKVPRGITVVTAEDLPTTTTGKIQKYKLIEAWKGAIRRT
jgi:fatty-acyl-CoA synthase